MDVIHAQANDLLEKIFSYATAHGTKTNCDIKMENDDVSSRNVGVEAHALASGDVIVQTTLKTKSGFTKKEDVARSYRVVARTIQYSRGDVEIQARHMVAEGNWYPNPYVNETAESSMALSRATGPAWVIENEEPDVSELVELVRQLDQQYGKKPA